MVAISAGVAFARARRDKGEPKALAFDRGRPPDSQIAAKPPAGGGHERGSFYALSCSPASFRRAKSTSRSGRASRPLSLGGPRFRIPLLHRRVMSPQCWML